MKQKITIFYVKSSDKNIVPIPSDLGLPLDSTEQYDIFILVHPNILPGDEVTLRCIEILENEHNMVVVYRYEYPPNFSESIRHLLETYHIPMSYISPDKIDVEQLVPISEVIRTP